MTSNAWVSTLIKAPVTNGLRSLSPPAENCGHSPARWSSRAISTTYGTPTAPLSLKVRLHASILVGPRPEPMPYPGARPTST